MIQKILFSVSAVLFVISFGGLSHADPKELLYQNYLLEQQKLISAVFDFNKTDTFTQFSLSTSAGTMKQKLNYNDPNDSRTFDQRFWVNKSLAKDKNAPTILFICGEGACGENNLQFISEQARTLGANMAALEHRYYGKSQPFADLSTEHLKYLTIEAALQDLHEFKNYAKIVYDINGQWIVVGGSYPGALSAYARSLNPNDFSGSLASSAPVMAALDFGDYDRHVGRVAGPSCLAAVQRVVNIVEQAIQDDQEFIRLKSKFDASQLRDRQDFLYLLADTGAAAIQYGRKEKFCELVENGGLDGYAQAAKMVSDLFGNLADMGAQAAEDISLSKHDGTIGIRQWFYQSCTELGYWQNATPDPRESARSSQINAAYHQRLCERLFALKTPAQVEKTNRVYYEPLQTRTVDKILFTNGSDDPWMNLSIRDDNKSNPKLKTVVMNGAAHCDDLSPYNKNPEVIKAQQLFLKLSKDWLGQ